jgi:hypothetical protein
MSTKRGRIEPAVEIDLRQLAVDREGPGRKDRGDAAVLDREVDAAQPSGRREPAGREQRQRRAGVAEA